MADAPLASFPVVIEQVVVWGDMDAYRHVNNVVYFRYFENARLEYLRRIDWPRLERETGIGPILASVSARFRQPLTYPDTIRIGARLTTIAEDRFTLEHVIVSTQREGVVTEGQGVVVAYHHGDGKKAALPEVLRRNIAALEGREV